MGIVEKVCEKEMTARQAVSNIEQAIRQFEGTYEKELNFPFPILMDKFRQLDMAKLVTIKKIFKNDPKVMAAIENHWAYSQSLRNPLRSWIKGHCIFDNKGNLKLGYKKCKEWASFL